MEKIKEPISKGLPPLVLYLDDIQEIYEFLKGISKRPVVIETCGYSLNSFDEFSKLREEKTNSITLKCYDPYIVVSIDKDGTSIYIAKTDIGDIEAEGIAANIEKILLPNKKFIAPFFDKTKFYVYICIVSGLTGVLVTQAILSKSLTLSLYSMISFIAQVGLIVFGMLFFTRWRNTIFFKSRKESPCFWRRNKDQIIVLIVTGIIVAIISSLVTVVITKKITTKKSTIPEPNSQKETVQQDVNSH